MNANDLFNDVMQLDLEPIKMKLTHEASGEGWSRDKADAVEKEYRRFLCLMKLYPDEDTAPLVDVDTFWHYHILDTMKYAADCDRVFGYFLHHYPYVGMRGGDDEQFRIDSGNRMRDLYETTFGEPYPGSTAGSTQAAYCAGPHAEAAYCAGPHAQTTQAAYCAGPHARTTQAAYCAGPHAEAAYCAGPHVETADAAYCAGPHARAAYCAGPHAQAAATAYCAGPHAEAAYCAGPHAQTAYCAGPHSVAPGKGTDVAGSAWCAGPRAAALAREHTATAAPSGPASPAGGAWHADAHRPAHAAGAATAWCAGPRG